MVAPVFEYKIGPFGGKDIVGAVLVNAVDGKHKYYDIKDIPNWVDRVLSSRFNYSTVRKLWKIYTWLY